MCSNIYISEASLKIRGARNFRGIIKNEKYTAINNIALSNRQSGFIERLQQR